MKIETFFANRKLALLIIGLLFLLLFLLIIRLIISSPPDDSPIIVVPKASFSPTPSIVGQPFPSVSFATPSAVTRPLVYQPGQLVRDTERITSKKPLSAEDQTVRSALLAPLNSQSGIVATTNQFQIEYVKSPDLFMIEVRSLNAAAGKIAAENYLKNRGLSTQGICNIPVVFYLSQGVQNDLLAKGQTFNPIPTGCDQ